MFQRIIVNPLGQKCLNKNRPQGRDINRLAANVTDRNAKLVSYRENHPAFRRTVRR